MISMLAQSSGGSFNESYFKIMIQIIIYWTISFIAIIISFTIGYYIVLNKLKRKLKSKNMLPEIGIRKIKGKHSVYFKYGVQTFCVFESSDISEAKWFESQITHLFTEYKNDIIDEI